MSNLVPKRVVNKNGVATTVHVRADSNNPASGRGIPAPAIQQNSSETGSRATSAKKSGSPKKGLLNWLKRQFMDTPTETPDQAQEPVTESSKAPFESSIAEMEKLVDRKNKETALSIAIVRNLPGGMRLAPVVKKRMDHGIERVTDAELLTGIKDQLGSGTGYALAVLKILESTDDPTEKLRRVRDHFDYAHMNLGWASSSAAVEFVADHLKDKELSIEQERAVLKLHDSRYKKHLTSNGGSITEQGKYHSSAEQIAIERPQDINLIIDIARERNPENVSDYHTLLDTDMSGPLGSGTL